MYMLELFVYLYVYVVTLILANVREGHITEDPVQRETEDRWDYSITFEPAKAKGAILTRAS